MLLKTLSRVNILAKTLISSHMICLFFSISSFLGIGTSLLECSKPWVITWISKTKIVSTCSNTSLLFHALNNSSLIEHDDSLQMGITSLLFYDINSNKDNVFLLNNNSSGSNCTHHVQLLNQKIVFYTAAAHWLLCSSVCAGLITVLETTVLERISSMKRAHSYGEQKVLAPIGSALGSFLSGVAIDHYKSKKISHFLASTYIYLPISLTVPVLLYIITKQTKRSTNQTIETLKDERESSNEQEASFTTSIKGRRAVFFLISTFVAGLTTSTYGSYNIFYIFQTLNPTKTIMSLMTVTSSFSNLIVLPFTGKIIRFYGGHNRCIIISLALFCLRLLCFTFCSHVWQIFLLQLMSGITRPLLFNAMIERTMALFPKRSLATAIGLFITISHTLTGMIASVLGGYLYHHYGAIKMFRWMALSLVWCGIMFVYYVVLGYDQSNQISSCNDDKSAKINVGDNINING